MVNRVARYSLLATQDFKSIHDFIAKDSPFYAKNENQFIKAKMKILSTNPLAGKKLQTLLMTDYRELIVKHYRVFYSVEDKFIDILSVQHANRDDKSNDLFKNP